MAQARERIRYECTCCGICCRWEGYVRVSSEEIETIADYLALSTEDFIQAYTRLTDDRKGLSLTESPDGTCIMLGEDNLCRINPVKPLQCKLFPNTWNFPGFLKLCEVRVIVND